jgi:hypothetical protein
MVFVVAHFSVCGWAAEQARAHFFVFRSALRSTHLFVSGPKRRRIPHLNTTITFAMAHLAHLTLLEREDCGGEVYHPTSPTLKHPAHGQVRSFVGGEQPALVQPLVQGAAGDGEGIAHVPPLPLQRQS